MSWTKLYIGISAGAVMVASASFASELTYNGFPYMDDRSSPQAVVESYYNAINRGDFPQAYSYFRKAPVAFDVWKLGYENTERIELRLGPTTADPGMSQIRWPLPVAIEAHHKDGSSKVFSGCYLLHFTEPGVVTEPPYAPIAIERGKFEETDKALEEALPPSCDSYLGQ